jgi:small ligand-binding sensory domain FIST
MAVHTRKVPVAVTALSERLETRLAARDVAAALRDGMRIRPDLLVVFGSFHHRALFSDAIDMLRAELHPAHVLACTAEGVASDGAEVERSAGLSAMALSLPGVVARPFHFSLTDGPPAVWSDGFIRERVSLPPDEGALPHRGLLMLADPFALHAGQACAAIERAAGPGSTRIFGGIASGASHAGLNVLTVDRRTAHEGIVGLSLFGDIEIDSLVSQGCRPVGQPLVVTRSRGGEILEIGGRPALEVTRAMAEALPEPDRELLGNGLLVGVAHDASKARLGRGDFLVRPVLEVRAATSALVLTDAVPMGSTIQFQIRDAQTAHDDLALLLTAEQLRTQPAAALLFTCNMRGTRLFAEAGHDARFASTRLGGAPICGFHAAGEIGPLGRHSYVHTQTASLAIFRAVQGAGA